MQLIGLIVTTVLVAAGPAATTGPAERVAPSSATVTGTVTPNGAATVYRVEYGTTSSYGLSTGDRDAGSSTTPVPVREPISGLTPETDYHYRVVAENSHGVTTGDDATFHTPAPVRPPRVTLGATFPVGATGVTLRATIRPHGAQTEYHFEYGTTVDFGQSSPTRTISDAGAGAVRVAEPIVGLRPHTRYYVRLVASNAAGRTVGPERTLFTLRHPTGVSIAVTPERPAWGEDVKITGFVSGDGVDGIKVALERLSFPFTGAFTGLGSAVTADPSGYFTFKIAGFYSTTRLRVVTETVVGATSPVAKVRVALRVSLWRKHLRSGRVKLSGVVRPAAPDGRATLHRRERGGGWTRVARTGLKNSTGTRSHYHFSLRPLGRARAYRVVVSARDGGAHVPGTTALRKLGAGGGR